MLATAVERQSKGSLACWLRQWKDKAKAVSHAGYGSGKTTQRQCRTLAKVRISWPLYGNGAAQYLGGGNIPQSSHGFYPAHECFQCVCYARGGSGSVIIGSAHDSRSYSVQ